MRKEHAVEHDGHCHVERLEKEVDSKTLQRAAVSLLAVEGMGCPNCALRVHNALLALPGVYEVKIDLERVLASVLHSPTELQSDVMIEAVSRAAVGTQHNYQARLLAKQATPLDESPDGL